MVCVVVGGGIIGIYLTSKTNDVSSNVTVATVNQELIKVNANLKELSDTVKKGNDGQLKLEGKTDENTRNIAELKQWKDAQEFKNAAVDRAIGKLEAK